MHHPSSLLALAALATPALADGTATWLWDVATDNGDAIVEPGETATVTLSMLMEPDDPGLDAWFAAAIFDCVGEHTLDDGVITGWDYPTNLHELTGDLATTDGVSIYNVNVGQLTVLGTGPFNDDNPIEVFTFDWVPAHGPQTVTYDTSTMVQDKDGQPIQGMLVWEGEDVDSAVAVHYPVMEGAVTINVVPAPSVGASAIVGFMLIRRRRS